MQDETPPSLDFEDAISGVYEAAASRAAAGGQQRHRRSQLSLVVLLGICSPYLWLSQGTTLLMKGTSKSSIPVAMNITDLAAANDNELDTSSEKSSTFHAMSDQHPPNTGLQNLVDKNMTKNKSQWQEVWKSYHLGDLIRFNDSSSLAQATTFCSSDGDDQDGSLSMYRHQTIICQYRKRTSEASKWETLIDVLEDQARQFSAGRLDYALEFPEPKDLVVHLRLGDGLCTREPNSMQKRHCRWEHRIQNKNLTTLSSEDKDYHEPSCWNDYRDCFGYDKDLRYALPRSPHYESLKEILSDLMRKNVIDKVVFVSDVRPWGWRRGDPRHGNFSVDQTYRKEASEWFIKVLSTKDNEIPVEFRSGEVLDQNPDQDFQYMSAARWFVPAGGGYSDLVAEVVKRRGGTILDPRRR